MLRKNNHGGTETQRKVELPGKEVLMITVDYPPGSMDPIHRHNAHG
jgi:quercetin dioxygenase-like cupin family protein